MKHAFCLLHIFTRVIVVFKLGTAIQLHRKCRKFYYVKLLLNDRLFAVDCMDLIPQNLKFLAEVLCSFPLEHRGLTVLLRL